MSEKPNNQKGNEKMKRYQIKKESMLQSGMFKDYNVYVLYIDNKPIIYDTIIDNIYKYFIILTKMKG
jgi:hypothetical protein